MQKIVSQTKANNCILVVCQKTSYQILLETGQKVSVPYKTSKADNEFSFDGFFDSLSTTNLRALKRELSSIAEEAALFFVLPSYAPYDLPTWDTVNLQAFLGNEKRVVYSIQSLTALIPSLSNTNDISILACEGVDKIQIGLHVLGSVVDVVNIPKKSEGIAAQLTEYRDTIIKNGLQYNGQLVVWLRDKNGPFAFLDKNTEIFKPIFLDGAQVFMNLSAGIRQQKAMDTGSLKIETKQEFDALAQLFTHFKSLDKLSRILHVFEPPKGFSSHEWKIARKKLRKVQQSALADKNWIWSIFRFNKFILHLYRLITGDQEFGRS